MLKGTGSSRRQTQIPGPGVWRAATTLLIAFVLIAGCQSRPKKAGGGQDRIIVLCDEPVWREVERALSEALEKEVFTPTRELVFELLRVDWDHFNFYRYRRNLLVIGHLGAPSEVSKLIGEMLTEEAKRKVRAGEAHLFAKEDAWAEGQFLLVVAAPEGVPLSSPLGEQKEALYDFFDRANTETVKRKIYGHGYQEDLGLALEKRYGWSISLPVGYKTGQEDSAGNLVSFIRHGPDRLIFVYWDEREGEAIDQALCLSTRNYIGDKYLEGDEIDLKGTKAEWCDFLNWKALRIKGIWHNDEKVMGGPFQTYCFYHKDQRRLYLVDVHVFAPGIKKMPWLKELDLICQTFRTSAL